MLLEELARIAVAAGLHRIELLLGPFIEVARSKIAKEKWMIELGTKLERILLKYEDRCQIRGYKQREKHYLPNKGDMHAHTSVYGTAIQTNKDPVCYRGPRRILSRAVETNIVSRLGTQFLKEGILLRSRDKARLGDIVHFSSIPAALNCRLKKL